MTWFSHVVVVVWIGVRCVLCLLLWRVSVSVSVCVCVCVCVDVCVCAGSLTLRRACMWVRVSGVPVLAVVPCRDQDTH